MIISGTPNQTEPSRNPQRLYRDGILQRAMLLPKELPPRPYVYRRTNHKMGKVTPHRYTE